jgi:DNA repair exonuclease SbcCD ATPase subunit
MARGKNAARSNVRRADAMAEHIDRLTDQLAEAKAKARRFESDARELPSCRLELARLRAQLNAETSDELERVRARLVADRSESERRIEAIMATLRSAADRVALTPDEWQLIANAAGPLLVEIFPDGTLSRYAARNLKAAKRRKHMGRDIEALL